MKAAADESSWDAILISKVRYGALASGKLGKGEDNRSEYVGTIDRFSYEVKGASDVPSCAESLCRFRGASPGAFLSVGRPVLGPDARRFSRHWLAQHPARHRGPCQTLIPLHGLQPHPALGLEKNQRG